MYLHGYAAGQLVTRADDGGLYLEKTGLGSCHGSHLGDGSGKGLAATLYLDSVAHLQLILGLLRHMEGDRHGILIGNDVSRVSGRGHGVLLHRNGFDLTGNGRLDGVHIQLILGRLQGYIGLGQLCGIGGVGLGIDLIFGDLICFLCRFQIVFQSLFLALGALQGAFQLGFTGLDL